ncbi:MAG: hypothetical protein WCK76_08570 [Elusimicrobiota bacterium]
MKKTVKYAVVSVLVLAGLAAAGLMVIVPEIPRGMLNYAKAKFQKPVPAEQNLTRLEAYNFVPGAKLEDRITVIPPALLGNYKDCDKAPEYEAYAPTAADKALVMEYLGLLPELYRKTLEERCLGIFFVKNFKGNGVTSWVTDAKDNVFFHITLNPAGLTDDISTTLSGRENSCFIPQAPGRITVDAGTKYKGLLYSLFHEATHGVDYVKGITPWADDTMPVSLRPKKPGSGSFFSIVWEYYSLPRKEEDYNLRRQITFYGLGGGPKLTFGKTLLVYTGLSRSSFASLYGSMSWAEDLAELATMYMLTAKLGQPYRITITGLEGGPFFLEPMRSPKVSARAAALMAELDSTGVLDELEAKGKELDEKSAALRARLKELNATLEKSRKEKKTP